jgi:hypothetical protein
MKKLLLIFFSMNVWNNIQAQYLTSEAAKLEMKYWKLRGRLIGDDNNKDKYNGFMTVGEGKGMSIPGVSRHPIYGRNNYDFDPNEVGSGCKLQNIDGIATYAAYDASDNVIPPALPHIDPRDGQELKGILKFSDNSLIQIGNYIAVLAVEWALLKRENKSTEQTEKELYYALKAIDRLDLAGENMYSTSATPSKNGFLMRCDVDEKFQLNTTGKNIDLVTSAIACKDLPMTSCLDHSNATLKISNAMSQDEVVGLLLGFALMRKMMPDYASYNGKDLRPWSRDITERIVEYVRKAGTTNFWTVVDPDQGRRVCRGSLAVFNSYGIASTAEYIFNYSKVFQNGWSLGLGKFLWKLQKEVYNNNNFATLWGYHIPVQMQTPLGMNTYEYIDIPGNNDWSHNGAYNISMFLKLLSCSKTAARPSPPYMDYTGKYLINTVSQTYKKHLYELLGSVIYGYAPILNESYWRGEFNKLTCGCNCMQGNNSTSWNACENYHPTVTSNNTYTPSNPWSTENRWSYHKEGGGDIHTLREFNGLDYMLAYNLYRWKYFSSGYNTRVRTTLYTIYPFLSAPNPYAGGAQYLIGSSTYPLERKAVFSIDCKNKVLSSGKLTASAGSDVKLLPGFHAQSGAVFQAKIKEYDCQPNINSLPGGSEYVSYKTNVDTFYDDDFNYVDTSISIQLDDDSLDLYNEGPEYDSNILVVTYTNNYDTVIYDLNPDYIFDEDGNIIYAPQGGNNKSTLDPLTVRSINLYPNPTGGDIYVEYMLYYDSEIKITVTNELGQIMPSLSEQQVYHHAKGKHKIRLHTSSLASGIYFCIIEMNGRKEVKKFTVHK